MSNYENCGLRCDSLIIVSASLIIHVAVMLILSNANAIQIHLSKNKRNKNPLKKYNN